MKQNIITRKIQVFVNEDDKELRKELIYMIYQWRDKVRKGANIVASHKFVQENIKDFIYVKDEIQEKFYVKNILKEGKGMSEQNTTYRILAEYMKGNVPSDIYSSLNQEVANTFKETKKDLWLGKASLRSYKNNIPMPFSANALNGLRYCEDQKRYTFTWFGVPMATALGADRSNNKVIIDRCLDKDNPYKICSSKLQIDDKKKKMFLLLCVSFPQEQVKLNEDKVLGARLSIDVPIMATLGKKTFSIGTKDEYLHRRLQIQAGLRRVQMDCKYNTGGKGRKRKMQAIERFEKAEKNYVDTKMHEYSRRLVDMAIKNECGKIVLLGTENLSEEIKADEFLLRNWTYHGLLEKLQYKCNLYGIELVKESAPVKEKKEDAIPKAKKNKSEKSEK
jgi:IS605 OrfB family transposase